MSLPLSRSIDLFSVSSIRQTLNTLPDERLVGVYLDCDNRLAFEEIVSRYQPRLVNFAYSRIGDDARSEDIAQETFLRVHRHLERFDQKKKFSTWIYTIASNLCKNELRDRSRSPLVLFQALESGRDEDERALEFEDERALPEEDYHRRELHKLVKRTIAAMPRHYRQVLEFRMQGMSYHNISVVSGCHLGTVKSRLHRAKATLMATIGPHLG